MSEQKLYTVSQLNNSVKSLLESEFALVRVEGEISNFISAASGHWYFSLKDDKAQIRGAMFKNANQHLRMNPENGMQVIALAKVSLYAPRGDYQLIIEHLEEVGNGALQRAFELLKQKLSKAGLFSQDNKKLLPEMPHCIGIVTSPTGAAVHDILKVLKRRALGIPVVIYPTLVQGDQAASNIARMIKIANERQECDVLIVGRGGGSLEDLWAFNEEVVAYAIYESSIPIISAVGHEVDVTIADFVADVRAPTPSAAAEMVSPNAEETMKKIARHLQRLNYSFVQFLKEKQQTLLFLRKRLRHPKALLQEQMQQVDELWQNLVKAQAHYFKQKNQHLAYTARSLNAVSPLATLDRGYAILRKDKHVIRDINEINLGDTITAQIKNGTVDCLVQEKTCT
jgi:exodeoxyribonuclease VII large subunit